MHEATSHVYRCFGLRVATPFACPELAPADGSAEIDVDVSIGSVPTMLVPADALRIDSPLGSCFVASGRRVVFEPLPGALVDELRQKLLGPAMAAVLYQRHVVPLHAGAVVAAAGAVLFAGQSTAGKSTLVAALAGRGLPPMADDLAAVAVDADGHVHVQPAYPQVKLAADVSPALDLDFARLAHLCRGLDKRGLSLADNFCHARQPVHRIYLLEAGDCAHPVIEATGGGTAAVALLGNLYRPWLCRGGVTVRWLFESCVDIAACVPMRRLIRPRQSAHPAAFEQLTETVLRDLQA
jgi:hypothetical protein